jgi:hypothetical protein
MEVKYRGEKVEVEYDTYGSYSPATYDSPAEYPEFIINAVYYNDVDIMPILTESDLELITEELYDNHE